MSPITFTSWNCRGLGKALKRGKVLSHLKSLSSDIIFLQETHIQPTEQRRLRSLWVSQVYQSTFSSKARGVAILIRKTIPFVFNSVTTDPGGRYVLVTGAINSFPLALLNIYAPNFDCPDFFRKVFNLCAEYTTHNMIIGGDFNCYFDPQLDRSSSKAAPTLKSVPVLNDLVKSLDLVDIWRLQHPLERLYSFFSPVHGTFTRIDHFLVDSKLVSHTLSSTYHSILVSDHAPLSIQINFNLHTPSYNWKFNPSLNSDKAFHEFISAKISEFLLTNDNGAVSDSILWESFKVVLRGFIISYQSSIKRSRLRRLAVIEAELAALEDTYRNTKDEGTLSAILKIKYDHNQMLGEQVGNYIRKLKQKHFELGDKPDKLLARQLRGVQADRAIHKISSATGQLITDPKLINDRFLEFFSQLYTSKSNPTDSDLDHFFNTLNIPTLNEAAKLELDSDLTLEEIKTAIRSFPNGKACGPDGFGIEFYKKHIDIIAPLLLRMINCSVKDGIFPSSVYDAHICLLLKKDRDSTNVASYRPLSLLNSDQKIVAKVLTNRLNSHVGTLIHSDQTGFIPDRFAFSNTRRLLNIMYSTNLPHSAVISLDAKQAFDQIEWRYMFATLKKFGFGDKFMTLLKMLYMCPKSTVLTNHDRSPPFLLHRGTRQGCSLSPLLFALALEPMAISIRSCPQITGIGPVASASPIGLYADDVILTLSDVKVSLTPLLELIRNFGQLSGFTINWEKSLFMPLSDGLTPAFLNNLPFKVSTDYFEYLGINITRNPKLLFKLNYSALIDKLKIMIDKWKLLPLSLIGRVNIVKMVVLPKFMYLFQNIPIYLTASFFKLVDSIIIPFIWADKPSRISKAHLHKPTTEGGLSLPVFRHYYWACNARALVFWSHLAPAAEQRDSLCPSWPVIETRAASVHAGASLAAILFSKLNLPFRCFKDDFVMRNTLKILKQIKGVLNLPGLSTYAPICQNPCFIPGTMDAAFVQWSNKGLTAIRDLYIDNHFASFAQLQAKFGLTSSHFFRYLQVRNFVRQSIPHFETLPEQHIFYDLMSKSPTSKRLISQFVNLFSLAAPSLHIKEAWVSDNGVEISDTLWAQGLNRIKSCSINARLQLIQFKVIHRLHFSKTKLNRMFPSVSATCDKCALYDGTLGHLFWSCPKLQNFWDDIFHLYSVIYSKQLIPDSLLIILGCSNFSLTLPSSLQQALMFGMVVAKRVILRDWKSVSPPCYKKWLNDMVSCIYLEEIRYTLSDTHHKFLEVWGPFIEYIRNDRHRPPD